MKVMTYLDEVPRAGVFISRDVMRVKRSAIVYSIANNVLYDLELLVFYKQNSLKRVSL
jgi:ribosomal protein S25